MGPDSPDLPGHSGITPGYSGPGGWASINTRPCTLFSLISFFLLQLGTCRTELSSSPPAPRPPPAVVHRFLSREPPQPCPAPPRASLELPLAGIDGPTANHHGSTTRAPPLRVDPLLRSFSTQIDHGNGFLVSSSTFPNPFPALSPPLRAPRAPPFTMGARGWLLFRYTRKLWIYVRILRTRDPGNSG